MELYLYSPLTCPHVMARDSFNSLVTFLFNLLQLNISDQVTIEQLSALQCLQHSSYCQYNKQPYLHCADVQRTQTAFQIAFLTSVVTKCNSNNVTGLFMPCTNIYSIFHLQIQNGVRYLCKHQLNLAPLVVVADSPHSEHGGNMLLQNVGTNTSATWQW